jgi:uncharacterized protein
MSLACPSAAEPPALGPTPPEQRLPWLDVLRGVAVLGILPINIQSFAMISMASVNPTAFGDLGGVNRFLFSVSYVLADQEFLTLFAMLFAAGLLFTAARVRAGDRELAALHYRRVSVLLAMGTVHAYGLWQNDILVPYAQCGLLLYPFRNLSARRLLALGLSAYAVYSALALVQGVQLSALPPEERLILAAQWNGHPALVAREIAALRGSWLGHFRYRLPHLLEEHTIRFFVWTLWRIGGVMLIGMALYRAGVLTGERSTRFYQWLALAGLGTGLALRSYGLWTDFASGFALEYSRYFGFQFKYWGSLLSALGYLGAVTLLVQRGLWPRAMRALAAVGRLSLTNYLVQTVICASLFYGWGLGWFGRVDRVGQLGIVVAIWTLQLAYSWLWTRHHRYGPVEAVWRRLSYGRLS